MNPRLDHAAIILQTVVAIVEDDLLDDLIEALDAAEVTV